MTSPEKRRLVWHCRRGTRELDTMLERFLTHRYDQADEDCRKAFERLLELPDPELHDVLSGAVAVNDPAIEKTARIIRERFRD